MSKGRKIMHFGYICVLGSLAKNKFIYFSAKPYIPNFQGRQKYSLVQFLIFFIPVPVIHSYTLVKALLNPC